MAYIEQEKVISELKNLPEQEHIEYMGIYDCIKSVPTADVVEVVRCKDCKHLRESSEITGFFFCGHFPKGIQGIDVTEDNQFCSYGELKESDTE